MHSLLILETLRRIFITRAFPLLLESSKVTISISFFFHLTFIFFLFLSSSGFTQTQFFILFDVSQFYIQHFFLSSFMCVVGK